MSALKFQLSHTPGLNGLRGLAVILVVLFHCANRYVPGGYIGVEIFFVLSGFLITQILLEEHARFGKISLRNFYARRVLRLAPALLLVLFTILIVSSFRDTPEEFHRSLKEVLASLFYVTNWCAAFELLSFHYLQHAWSLSIEEQYYVLWPLGLLLLIRSRFSWRGKAFLIFCLWLASIGLRVFFAIQGVSAERMYNGLDTRADGLLLGSMFAITLSHLAFPPAIFSIARKLAPLLVLFALIIIFCTSFLLPWRHTGLYLWGISAVGLSTLVILAEVLFRKEGLINRFLELPFLVWLGTISYGLYLWHYPIMKMGRDLDMSPWLAMPLSIALSIFISALSYYLLEKPFLKLKNRFR